MIKTTQLISTAIMKTDIIGFSSIVGEFSDFELSKLLEEHKEFIIRIIYKYNGSIVKGEGDAFLISFSSVTSATEAAVEIQKKLRKQRENVDGKFRLSLKIMISLGDVMHKNNDIYGESVNIISRIEDITPPDEIFLSESASLTLRAKNVNLELVGGFEFKGFTGEQKIYRVILGRKTLVLENQYIMFSDLAGFTPILENNNYELFENNIDNSDIMFQNIVKKFNGSIRTVVGDAYIVTFNKIGDIINSINYVNEFWGNACNKFGLNRMRLGCHKDKINIYRSCIAGNGFNLGARLESWGKNLVECQNTENKVITHTSSIIYNEAIEYEKGTKEKFRKVTKQEIINKMSSKEKTNWKKMFNNCTYSYNT